MKIFHTPAIDGIYRPLLQKRLEDKPTYIVYSDLQTSGDKWAIDELDEKGYVKIKTYDVNGDVDGYFTYQQDDL